MRVSTGSGEVSPVSPEKKGMFGAEAGKGKNFTPRGRFFQGESAYGCEATRDFSSQETSLRGLYYKVQ